MTYLILLIQVAVKTLPFYNKYFNIAYPLPKIDLIAIADFAAGMCYGNFALVYIDISNGMLCAFVIIFVKYLWYHLFKRTPQFHHLAPKVWVFYW